MKAEEGKPIEYFGQLGGDFLQMNQLMGRNLRIRYLKNQCLGCGNDRPIFRMGYCQSCFFELPQAGEWVIRPELSKAHRDEEDRDLEFEKEMQLQPHIVYLADTGSVKVGVTRKSQVPTRWIDQGAGRAIPIIETPNRFLAGLAEVALKERAADKTSPGRMLTGIESGESLESRRMELLDLVPGEVRPYILESPVERSFIYPVTAYPDKVKTFRLDHTDEFSGTLTGIRGQYLLFSGQLALNIRGHEGYFIGLDIH